MGWLGSSSLKAQPITLTHVVVLPKQTALNQKPIRIALQGKNSPREPVIIPYNQNDFYVNFRAPGLPPPYQFRLRESHVDYTVQTTDSFAYFTNIPSGEYEFTVWSVARPELPRARLWVRVEAPLWLRWWFLPMLFLYGLVLIGVLFYFLYRYRLRQFMRVHAVRENIARDLHDDMGSYLSSISVMSQSVVNLAQKDPQKAHALVQKIGETARQVMDSMGDIIWSVNPDNDSMAQLAVRMRDLGADLLEDQNVTFNLDMDEGLLQRYLPLEQRHDFFLIYKEGLTNCAKYAQATHVWVRLHQKGNALELTIQDDGVGFDPAQPHGQNRLGGNGLKNMQARAKKMGGTFVLTTAPGQGTIIRLFILLP